MARQVTSVGHRCGLAADGSPDRRHGARIADVVTQRGVDLMGRLDRWRMGVYARVEHPLADRVEGAGHTRPDLAWPQRSPVLARRHRDRRALRARPSADERGVQQPSQVHDVRLVCAHRVAPGHPMLLAARAGPQDLVDHEADQLDRARLGDHHVLGQQPAVGHAAAVRRRDRLGDLLDHPGRSPRGQRPLHEHPVQRDARAPLVHHVHHAVLGGSVQDAQQMPVTDQGRGARRGQQRVGAGVRVGEHVDGDAAGEGLVRGAPEACPVVLVEQVLEAEPPGEHGPRSEWCAGHVPPRCLLLGLLPGLLLGITGVAEPMLRAGCPGAVTAGADPSAPRRRWSPR